jgi:hemoglobin
MFQWILAAIVAVIILFLIFNHFKSSGNSLYNRLGGIYNIAAVVNHFSDALIENPIAGRNTTNPHLREWYATKLDRLPGLKFMRTLWLASISGGPFTFHASTNGRIGKCPFSLENAHKEFQISNDEFAATASELSKTLDLFHVPPREKKEVIDAFVAHRGDIVNHIASC